jgi:hypothetical protein
MFHGSARGLAREHAWPGGIAYRKKKRRPRGVAAFSGKGVLYLNIDYETSMKKM